MPTFRASNSGSIHGSRVVTEGHWSGTTRVGTRRRHARSGVLVGLLLTLVGCGEPSRREVDNARAFEALLTSVSMTNVIELEKNAKRIEQRHEAQELSDARYKVLQQIIEKARARDWTAAEKQAYEFRAEFGDNGSYFK